MFKSFLMVCGAVSVTATRLARYLWLALTGPKIPPGFPPENHLKYLAYRKTLPLEQRMADEWRKFRAFVLDPRKSGDTH